MDDINLITVHGTFAARETEWGPEWWQKDPSGQYKNEFYQECIDFFRQRRHQVITQPFRWSGANSHIDRLRAGIRLKNEIVTHEKAGSSYAVVAHSHAGNIVWIALWYAFWHLLRERQWGWRLLKRSFRDPLPGLKGWVTVGTPFLFLRRGVPFFELSASRLSQLIGFITVELSGAFGEKRTLVQSFFLSALLTPFMLVMMPVSFVWSRTWKLWCALSLASTVGSVLVFYFPPSSDPMITAIALVVLFFSAIPSAFLLLFMVLEFLHRGFEKKIDDLFHEAVQARWFGICHPDDEALKLLSISRYVQVNPIHAQIFSSLLRNVYALALLALVFGIFLLVALSYAGINAESLFGIFVSILLVFLFAIALHLLFRFLPKVADFLFSRPLNRFFTTAIRYNLQGNDIYGDPLYFVGRGPLDVRDHEKILEPCELDPLVVRELRQTANLSISQRIETLRSVVLDPEYENGLEKELVIDGSLNFLKSEDLIHTCYFLNGDIRRLIFEVLAQECRQRGRD